MRVMSSSVKSHNLTLITHVARASIVHEKSSKVRSTHLCLDKNKKWVICDHYENVRIANVVFQYNHFLRTCSVHPSIETVRI